MAYWTQSPIAGVGLAYLVTRFMLFLIIVVSALAVRTQARANGLLPPSHNPLLDGSVHRHSGEYLAVAEHGYRTDLLTAVFPGYPLAIGGLAARVGHPAGVSSSATAWSA